MAFRSLSAAALSSFAIGTASVSASAQTPILRTASRPSATIVTGVLKGAAYAHDGKSEWAAFVAGESATYGITGGGEAYNRLKKLVGKRVVVKGFVATEFVAPSGEKLKLSGKVGGINYDGNVGIESVDDVALQPTTGLAGTVEEVAPQTGTDQKRGAKTYRLMVSGANPATYSASPTAAKKLKDFVGKQVVVRCFLNGETIDEVERATPAKEAASRPAK